MVHVSRRPQLPPDGAERGSSGLQRVSMDKAVFTICDLLGASRPASLLDPRCGEEAFFSLNMTE